MLFLLLITGCTFAINSWSSSWICTAHPGLSHGNLSFVQRLQGLMHAVRIHARNAFIWTFVWQNLCCCSCCALQCRPAVLFLAFVIDAAFALAIVGFLIMHCRMIAKNMTTIEMYEKRRSATGPWQFDRGAKQNFLEVFGKRCRCYYVQLFHYALLVAHCSQS